VGKRLGGPAGALIAVAVLVPAAAMGQASLSAQPAPPPSASEAGATSATAPAAPPPSGSPESATPASAAPAGSGSARVVPATGYGWSTPKPSSGVRVRASHGSRARPTGPDALMPGFEVEADGSTRLFVELSQQVAFDTKKGPGNSIIYVLKGARVDRRNNYNPLVTVHFNTPVTSARLVPHGKDLWFLVDLRANVTPTATMEPSKDGGAPATLRIDFPKGDYLPVAGSQPPAENDSSPASR